MMNGLHSTSDEEETGNVRSCHSNHRSAALRNLLFAVTLMALSNRCRPEPANSGEGPDVSLNFQTVGKFHYNAS
jgi:hypothetical protein